MRIAPLSARSVALSVLLGAPEGRLPVRDLLAAAEMCGIASATMRVALSRLVSARELSMTEGVYTLSPHHLERLAAQESDLAPELRAWDGTWELVAVVETGRDAVDRARLRADLSAARLAELREGVWMRPANLDRPAFTDPHTTMMLARPADPALLVTKLWNLDEWAETGRALLAASTGPQLNGQRLAAVAALVRHLRTDPALPHELTPPDWPAAAMRAAYADYRTQLQVHNTRREGALT
jgi:phenylacetic acid degradation operon negative regulatory protein